ncbi:MAG: hypothetical protein EXQ97_00370 [Alphaproteobacteria bacterium]|nr:hypothetical protein [Alphaproteobacteria bacterium]
MWRLAFAVAVAALILPVVNSGAQTRRFGYIIAEEVAAMRDRPACLRVTGEDGRDYVVPLFEMDGKSIDEVRAIIDDYEDRYGAPFVMFLGDALAAHAAGDTSREC